MASAAVMTAVATRLASWSNLSACPLVPINEVADSPKSKFLAIEYPVANEDRITLGQPALYRESGGIRFVLHCRVSDGIASLKAYADELRDLFRDAEFGGVVTFEAPPPPYDERNRRGVFYAVPFVVLYQYDVEK